VPKELREAFQKYGFKAGFLKLTLLKLISKGPIHGYALMKEIERITDEEWKPSPGSIYPALQELVHDDLVVCNASEDL
jgi:DNA-binding PadR family transcriptional regulator